MARRILVLVTLALACIASPVAAGGWALAELVAPPEEVRAGEAVTIEIRLLQHGVTPVADGQPVLVATHRESTTEITVDGEAVTEQAGTYRFDVTFPEAGSWKWHVTHEPFPGMTAFPALEVLAGDAAATPAAATGSSASADAAVSLAETAFSPTRLEITAGTTVTWTNNDTVPHQVASPDALDFEDSPMLQPGESYAFTFSQPGEYKIICGPHLNMGMLVVVM